MGEVNNDWSNFILTAIEHYWNELALSAWPLAEQLFTKPRNLSDSLGTAQPQTHVAPNFPLNTEGDSSCLRAPHTHLVAVICAAPFWHKSAAVSHHNSCLTDDWNIIYLSYLAVLSSSSLRNLVLNWMQVAKESYWSEPAQGFWGYWIHIIRAACGLHGAKEREQEKEVFQTFGQLLIYLMTVWKNWIWLVWKRKKEQQEEH